MGEVGKYQRRAPRPKGYWGKWRNVKCAECEKPAKVRGFCDKHYGKWRWKTGVRAPSADYRGNRNRQMRYRYGIGLADYEAMLRRQRGVCAICKKPPGKGTPTAWKG